MVAKKQPAKKTAAKKPAKKPAAKRTARKAFKQAAAAPKPPMFPPICEAAMHGELDRVNELLAAGANIEEPDNNDGSTPLILATRYAHPEVALELLARGANAKAQEKWGGGGAMIWAATNNLVEVGRKLLEGGAKPDLEVNNTRPMRVEQEFHDMIAAFEAEAKAAQEAKRQAQADAFARALDDSAILQRRIPVFRPIVLKPR